MEEGKKMESKTEKKIQLERNYNISKINYLQKGDRYCWGKKERKKESIKFGEEHMLFLE